MAAKTSHNQFLFLLLSPGALSKLKVEVDSDVIAALTKLKVFRRSPMQGIESGLTEHSAAKVL